MKALICELCEGNDFVKKDGFFVCQHCGTKYTLEEAKKIMIEGSVTVSGTVKIDNTDTINNYIKIGQDSLRGGNGQGAFEYANKALEVSPYIVDAWVLKMKSLELLGTVGNPRLSEIMAAGNSAIDNAPEIEKRRAEKEVYEFYYSYTINLLKWITNWLLEDIPRLQKAKNNVAVFGSVTDQVILNSDINTVPMYDNIACDSFRMALSVPAEGLAKHVELVPLLNECSIQFQNETNALMSRFQVHGWALDTNTVNGRNELLRQAYWISEEVHRLSYAEKEKELQSLIAKYNDESGNAELRKKIVNLSLEFVSATRSTQYKELISIINQAIQYDEDDGHWLITDVCCYLGAESERQVFYSQGNIHALEYYKIWELYKKAYELHPEVGYIQVAMQRIKHILTEYVYLSSKHHKINTIILYDRVRVIMDNKKYDFYYSQMSNINKSWNKIDFDYAGKHCSFEPEWEDVDKMYQIVAAFANNVCVPPHYAELSKAGLITMDEAETPIFVHYHNWDILMNLIKSFENS